MLRFAYAQSCFNKHCISLEIRYKKVSVAVPVLSINVLLHLFASIGCLATQLIATSSNVGCAAAADRGVYAPRAFVRPGRHRRGDCRIIPLFPPINGRCLPGRCRWLLAAWTRTRMTVAKSLNELSGGVVRWLDESSGVNTTIDN